MRLRPIALLLSGVVVASSASACSDAATTSPLATPERAELSRSSNNESADTNADGDAGTYVFSVDPTRPNHLEFGEHSLDIPANAICDASSDYGPASWDAPCRSATNTSTITVAVWGTVSGLPRVDLQPAIRFSPLTNVVLRLYVEKPAHLTSYSVLYCATLTSPCVDESLSDPTLVAIYDRPTQTLVRRIKHFSGYLVAERY